MTRLYLSALVVIASLAYLALAGLNRPLATDLVLVYIAVVVTLIFLVQLDARHHRRDR